MCPFVVRKGSFYKLTAWRKIARCAVYAVLIPYKHSRSRPYYVFRSSVQLLSSVVCCRSKCTRISRWRMPKMFRQKLITRHIPVYCADCQCVMAWWVARRTRHLRVSLPLVWRVAVSTRHTVTACPSECYAPVWRVTSFFRKSFCVVLSLTLSWIWWFFRNLVEIVSLRYVVNVIRWCLVNQASIKLRKNQFGWLQAGFFLLYVYSGLPLCAAAAPIII